MFQGNLKDVEILFYGTFLECFREDSKVFKECFICNFVVLLLHGIHRIYPSRNRACLGHFDNIGRWEAEFLK